jgi:hypothetical protein
MILGWAPVLKGRFGTVAAADTASVSTLPCCWSSGCHACLVPVAFVSAL